MERRGFFKSLIGLFVVGAVDPASLLKSEPDAAALAVGDLSKQSFGRQFSALTWEMLRILELELKSLGATKFNPIPHGEVKIGTTVRFAGSMHWDTFILDKHLSINMDLDPSSLETLSDEDIRQRFVTPAMCQLANLIMEAKPRGFGRLPMPPSSGTVRAARSESRESEICISGYQAYAFTEHEGKLISYLATRFDVLFG